MKKNDEAMYEISKKMGSTELLINFTDIKNEDFGIYANKDFKLKSDRNFIIDCLNKGVDGRILEFVNPYIFFKSYPLDLENISSFFNRIDVDKEKFVRSVNGTLSGTGQDEILDVDFLEKIFALTEHAFWAISRNSSMQDLLDYGTFLDSMQFEGLDIFWELAFKNQKFYFKYYYEYELNDKSWLEEYYGKILSSTKKNIFDNFESFSLSVFDDYARTQIGFDKEVSDQVNIIKQNFKEYLSSIISRDLDNFYTKHNLDKSLIEFRTALKHFQKVTFDIKDNNL
ncbi:hypothetical protein N8870_06770 [Alphaproteobacteria bacterium]|nr:hypothetical protein [Alphaproteobacteria bacterium]